MGTLLFSVLHTHTHHNGFPVFVPQMNPKVGSQKSDVTVANKNKRKSIKLLSYVTIMTYIKETKIYTELTLVLSLSPPAILNMNPK